MMYVCFPAIPPQSELMKTHKCYEKKKPKKPWVNDKNAKTTVKGLKVNAAYKSKGNFKEKECIDARIRNSKIYENIKKK